MWCYRAWGDGTSVAADGTQMDTFIDNLFAESSLRYKGALSPVEAGSAVHADGSRPASRGSRPGGS
ncbi:Tn3 family transposase [Streptomyces sp. NPDC029006]|uniref:Tn3 family transposase n=1 Tax=Streptomyces sp. NPDC029006 TaxID=3155467 RepID=UPI0033D780E8